MTFPALGWDQEADVEEGRPTDADALSPDWDHTVLEGVGGFDSETDADGDLNTSSASPKIGTSHCRVVFDDANAAYGVINATAINQTEGVVDMWFDPRDVALEGGTTTAIMELVDGGGTRRWYLEINDPGTGVRVRAVARNDDGSFTVGSFINLSADYHHLRLVLQRSSGVGNDDGFMYFYVDDGTSITVDSNTGIDNDTRDWDDVRVGMATTNSTSFGGGYDIDEIRVSESVSPVWITEAAALAGSFGAAFTIEDATNRYIQLSGPTNETKITLESEIDTTELSMTDGDEFIFMDSAGSGTNPPIRVSLKRTSGAYQVQFYSRDDGGSIIGVGSSINISDGQHTIRAVWQASSGAGNDDGELHGYIDNELQVSGTGHDNDTHDVDTLRMGPRELDSGTSGVFFMDDMRWADNVILPQSAAGSISPSGALAAVYTQLISLAGSISPSGALSTAATFVQSVAGSISPSGSLTAAFQVILKAAARFVATITQDAHYDDTVEGAARYDNEIEQDAHLR